MPHRLSSNAEAIVNGSLKCITKKEELERVDAIVGDQVGGLSLSLAGDAWDRTARLQRALIEIAGAYVRSLAEHKLQQ